MTRIPLPPTRITPTTISSIDCVCTNFETTDLKLSKVHILNSGLSDHTAQLSKIQHSAPEHKAPTLNRRHFNQRNISGLKTTLGEENWANVYSEDNTEKAYTNFNQIITSAINLTCPLVKTRIRQRKATKITDHKATQLKANFLEAQNRYILYGTEEHKKDMANKKKTYDLRLKFLRRQQTANTIEEADNKQKALWNIINSERKSSNKTEEPIELEISGVRTQDPNIVANYLNVGFTNTVNNTYRQTQQQESSTISSTQIQNMVLQPTNVHEVLQVVKDLKSTTSAGIDDISAKLLKSCTEQLVTPLVHIINISFKEGVFPTGLKTSKVYPKFKKGNRHDPKNYRPISLIPTFSKVFEKIVLNRLLKHLQLHQLLTSNQHGFISGRSTISAITNLVEFLIDNLESGNIPTSILLDFSKAFDCLDHTKLIDKMKAMGINGITSNWFKSFLTGRTQMVELKHSEKGVTRTVRSRLLPTTRGVPQGSVLGPILFILFTNDLPEYLDNYNTTLMYADDTILLLGEKSPETVEVQSAISLNMAIQYCHSNNLVINEEKTQQLVFGRKRDAVGRLPGIQSPDEAKYLGIIIDEKLSWTPHIDSLCSKLSCSLYVIKRIKSIGSKNAAKIAYYAIFESHLRYGLRVWGNSSTTNLQRVLVSQKKAVRVLAGLNSKDSCRQKFIELKILTVVCLYILEVVTYAGSLQLQKGTDRHSHNTRQAANYILPVHHLSIFEEKPSYIGTKFLNLIPKEAKGEGLHNLKRHLTSWLLERPFYNIDEFLNWRTLSVDQL